MGVPYTFGTATTSIPLSQLDANFNTPVTLGNTTVGLGNTVTTVGNLTLTNVNITSGTINSAVVVESYALANAVVYSDASKDGTTSANLTFNGTTFTAVNDASISGLTVGRGGGAVSTNTAVGVNSLLNNNVSATTNTGIGYNALNANTTGIDGTAVGAYSLYKNTTGNSNSALGGSNSTPALYNNTTGSSNSAFGVGALFSNTTASNNTAVGYQAGYSNTTGASNVAVGNQAGYSNQTSNRTTAIGHLSLYSNTAAFNTATGAFSLNGNTTGSENSAFGDQSLYSNTTGANNVAVGRAALNSNTTASNNTAVGYQALYTQTTPSAANSGLGYQAGYSITTGIQNTCMGTESGRGVTTGSGNTFLGHGSGYYMTTGSKNTIVGKYDGNQGGLDIRTASNYIVLSDGDGNPRGFFDNNGTLIVSGTTTNPSTNVVYANPEVGGQGMHLVVGKVGTTGSCLYLNRESNDGTLVEFRQANINEGTISVSGSTVSYNGGHLSRYSQLPSNKKDDTLLKGTVMSNLDDMCVWTKDGEVLPNEQLNKMKVSDVEGDTNVAGVFVNWTFDEQCQSDDMNVAMTGDMIIRIAQGVVVQKGDLLMSAGDGTAKPQGDDIRRSKTVAKVTSNHVTCTYEDGSYCVPCVLMAC